MTNCRHCEQPFNDVEDCGICDKCYHSLCSRCGKEWQWEGEVEYDGLCKECNPKALSLDEKANMQYISNVAEDANDVHLLTKEVYD